MDYYAKGGLDFAHHQPYAIKYTFEASTWAAALAESDRILREFQQQLSEDEKEEARALG